MTTVAHHFLTSKLAALLILLICCGRSNADEPIVLSLGDLAEREPTAVSPVVLWQPTPLLDPRLFAIEPSTRAQPSATPQQTNSVSARFSISSRLGPSAIFPTGKDQVTGSEAATRSTTDIGDLLRKSPAALSVGVQAKTPVVNDPRIRGSRVGSLATAGSHWVPARIDLDTMVSKFDSRLVESTLVIPGPYTSLLGPSFAFTEVELYRSPRYNAGFESHGASDLEYRSNGTQLLGQQTFLAGSSAWGARGSYTVRDGDDYESGDGTVIPSSYHSEEMLVSIGFDLGDDSIEFTILRLDQSDVIFPGYVFDIDDLLTEGYELTYRHGPDAYFDAVELELWYNQTQFNGNAQNSRKRAFFPVLDLLSYVGFTNVDSMSAGYRQAFVLGRRPQDSMKLTFGHDLRVIEQELNEISNSETIGFPILIANRNSPIPESLSVNPGCFVEYEEQITEHVSSKLGGRVDYVATNIIDDPSKLAEVGLDLIPTSYAEVVGTTQYAQDFSLLSCFLSSQYAPTRAQTWNASIGFAERAPTLTELYAAQPFMLLLQNGLNNVTGDPTLDNEKLLQLDLGYEYRDDTVLAGVRGYHAWVFDYITFENTQTTLFPPDADARQVSLRYVNTDLATLTGIEAFTELYPHAALSPLWNMRFVSGTDQTRNGDFATTNGSAGNPSQKDPSQVRGFYSGIVGGATEALPSIPPLENRIGIRFQDTSPLQRWRTELVARIVDAQSRVAASLLESPTSGFTVWDLRCVVRPGGSDQLLITTGIENLLDRRFREHLDYRTPTGLSVLQPGVNFYAGLRLTY